MSLFEVKELDYQKTRHEVNKVMRQHEKSLMRIESKCHPKITQTFQLEMPQFGNGFNSSTENAALYRIEGIDQDEKLVLEINDVINRLNAEYRQVFVMAYIQRKSNKEISIELNLSESSVSLKKRFAIELFSYGMGIEVYYK